MFLFTPGSAGHALLIVCLVAALGLMFGSVRILGIRLGIGGVLFSGLLFGHFGLTVHPAVMEFLREFGLILFVYSVGLQLGPGFFASFKRDGMRLNVMAAFITLAGAAITVAIHHFGGVDLPVAVGLFSGATTNTPSLAAAQQALKDVAGVAEPVLKMPAVGYAIAYPFGILGIILTLVVMRALFKIQPLEEEKAFIAANEGMKPSLTVLNLLVNNPNLDGVPVSKIPSLSETGVVISRVLHKGEVEIARPDTVLARGDVILAVGTKEKLEDLRLIVGSVASVDLRSPAHGIVTRRIVVTKKAVIGKTVSQLDLLPRYEVTITRVIRSDIELPVTSGIKIQFGDVLLAVGEPDSLKLAAGEVGNAPRTLDHPQLIPVFLGIALGVLAGSVPFNIPGIPVPVKLGFAGGPLVVAILLSRVSRIGSLVWYMPVSANFMLREIGIVLFLACVGLRSGDQFLETLVRGPGLYWMGLAACITLIPLATVAVFARLRYRMNFFSVCGLWSGSMTDPPALAYANSLTSSNAPALAYATVYPLVMILRVIEAQVLVIFLMR